MDKLVLFVIVHFYQVYCGFVQEPCNWTEILSFNDNCLKKEISLCKENHQSIRITSAVNGTGSGILVVCGQIVRKHLIIMAGNDEIFPLSTGRYKVTVSESGYHSTVNITVHNLTEHDQGVIPLYLFTCRKQCIVTQLCVDLKGSRDEVNFTYTFGKDNNELLLKLKCESTGYPRSLSIMDVKTHTILARTTSNRRNYQPKLSLEVYSIEISILTNNSYICEVTDFLRNNSTHLLHVAHPSYPLRLFNNTANNSVIYANVNETVMFSFDVISSGDINIDFNSNWKQANITKSGLHNVYNVLVLINFTQESDYRKYTIQLAKEHNNSDFILVHFIIQLKDRPHFCYNPNPNYTFYTRPSENLSVNFCLKSGVDIQHPHKMEVYVDNQRLSDKDIQVTKYNSRYQYGLDIVLHKQTFNTTSWILIRVFNVTLKCRVNVVINAALCNNDTLKQPIPARLDQPLTIQFCVVSSSLLHNFIAINGHIIKVNTSHVTGIYRYVGVRRSGDDNYNVTIQLYPADVDDVQIFEVVVKNEERETMPYVFKIKLLRENKTSIGPSHTSMPVVTISTSSVSAVSTAGNTQLSNNFQFLVPFITMATTTVILVVILICVVTHYKQVNRCTSKDHRPNVHTDRYYMNVRFNPGHPYNNDAVTPEQDGESYRPSLTLELSSLHHYSEVQDVHSFPHYSEAGDTRGHQHWEIRDRDTLTIYPQDGHYSLVEVRDSLAPAVSEPNQSGGVTVRQLTSEQLQELNDGYITPIDHYSSID